MRDQTIALAGVYQAAAFAHELAQSGAVSRRDCFAGSIESLFAVNPDSTMAVFDHDMNRISLGLSTLIKSFNKDKAYLNIIKYVLTLLNLQSKFITHDAMVKQVQHGIQQASHIGSFDEHEKAVIEILAATYSKTISQLQPRVVIAGQPFHLKNNEVTMQIRAVLLAGIRSAVLWKQVGGSHLQLLFKRKAYIQEAEQLLKQR
ncbi:high frequency lysogenization protein HflD [Marinicella gelatinilytica]|uniref:high frequency lysogenization protein HflD n=1 Tax=Marinicella gelatinilytica TaxID=2996017 RepID=UPI002260ABFB|nr:high frequency lysogenization protein HflD [Marinicella gelatinilytica]MCX7543939.1 high frequency lysogenization protein HflD [Marinicella gelatinilytica]